MDSNYKIKFVCASDMWSAKPLANRHMINGWWVIDGVEVKIIIEKGMNEKGWILRHE